MLGEVGIVRCLDNQMLWSVGIGEVDHLLLVFEDDDAAMLQRLCRNLLAGKTGQLSLDGFADRLDQSRLGRNQEGLAIHAVLGLREEVGRDELGIGREVGDNLDLRRTGGHVYRHVAKAHPLLGGGYILVARSKYLIYFRDRLGPVGHGRNRLTPAYLADEMDAGHLRGKEDGRMHSPVFPRRRTKDDLATPGNLRRNGKHQDRGEERSRSARDVQADFLDRHRLLPADYARGGLDLLPRETLGGVEGADIRGGTADGILQRIRHEAIGFFFLFVRYNQTI